MTKRQERRATRGSPPARSINNNNNPQEREPPPTTARPLQLEDLTRSAPARSESEHVRVLVRAPKVARLVAAARGGGADLQIRRAHV